MYEVPACLVSMLMVRQLEAASDPSCVPPHLPSIFSVLADADHLGIAT